MVILNKIYTRTGDDGSTALGNSERRKKYDLRVESYGTVDEANAAIGLARLHMSKALNDLDDVLAKIQNDLFDLGSDLAVPQANDEAADETKKLRIISDQVEMLEREIDHMNEALEPLRSFILPGGSPASAHLHMARTIVRRAERLVVALAQDEVVNPSTIHYLNRLSDFLFVAARFANGRGKDDVQWVPGKNRS